MNEESPNPYSPPLSDPYVSPRPGSEGDLALATPITRLGSAMIDGVINLSIYFAVGQLLSKTGITSIFTGHSRDPDQLYMPATIGGVVIFYLVQWHFLKSTGQTIGKRITKIKIVTMEGSRPSMTDLALRRYGFMNVFNFLPPMARLISLVDICFIFRKDHRCLHDLIAGTKVVQVEGSKYKEI